MPPWLCVKLIAANPALASERPAVPQVFGWDGVWMAMLREEVKAKGNIRRSLRLALDALYDAATVALALKPPSVTTTGCTPLPHTGVTAHDLWYLATYSWPCGTQCNVSKFKSCDDWWKEPHYHHFRKCNNETGMPWEEHDGYTQTEDIADMQASDAMSDAVVQLSLAHYFSGNVTFGFKAIELLDAWFVNEDTLMAPNLNHAAVIPGVTNGSNAGVIVTSHRWNSRLFDSVALLNQTGVLPNVMGIRLQAWNEQYLEWLMYSANGVKEGNMHQNHATWYTVLSSALANSVGKAGDAVALLSRLTNNSIVPALGHQIWKTGQMPFETNRTDGIGYSCMSVAGLFNAAQIAKNMRHHEMQAEAPDLFGYMNASDGTGSVRAALDYLLQFATNTSKPWPFSQSTKAPTWPQLGRQMLMAAKEYNDTRYEEMIPLLPWDSWPTTWESDVSRLLFPSTIES